MLADRQTHTQTRSLQYFATTPAASRGQSDKVNKANTLQENVVHRHCVMALKSAAASTMTTNIINNVIKNNHTRTITRHVFCYILQLLYLTVLHRMSMNNVPWLRTKPGETWHSSTGIVL